MTFTILIVCSGNSCRSPMAEGILHDFLVDKYGDRVRVHSAGTLGIFDVPAADMAIRVCRELEVDISSHRSKGVTTHMIAQADLILCMAYHHKADIISSFPPAESKTFLLKEFAGSSDPNLDVPDPIGGDYQIYTTSRDEIHKLIEMSLDRIEKRIQNEL